MDEGTVFIVARMHAFEARHTAQLVILASLDSVPCFCAALMQCFCYNHPLNFVDTDRKFLKEYKVLDNVSLQTRLDDLQARTDSLRGYL